MAFDELAQRLFGARRAESDAILTDATTGTIHGVALTDSEGGAVTVEITADVTAPEPLEVGGETYFADAGVGVEIPTSESVRAGDEVLVSTYGAGTMRSPVVTAAVGSGDRMAAAIADAESIAEQAEAVASATGQHFWPDTDGVHVTEVTQDEWGDSTSPSYHSGANVLINALGQLFRDGLNNLLALVAGSIKSEQFTIEDTTGPNYFTLSSVPVSDDSVIVTSSSSDLSDEYWNYLGDGRIVVLYEYASTHYGAEITARYRTSSGMALYDGAGNDGENVVASFTGNGITIGRTDGWHVVLDSSSFEIYDGATMRSSFSADEITLNALNIWTVLTDEAFLYNPSGISLGSAYNSRSGAGTVMGGFSSSGLNVTMAGNTLQVIETAYASGVPVVSSTSTFTMANVINELTESSGTGTYASPFSAYDGSNGNLPRWWRSGNVVHFSGIATVTSQQADATRTLFTLPAGFRPNDRNRYLGRMQGSGTNSWELSVETSGAVKLQRYGTTSAIALPSGVWLPYAGTFII